MPAPDANAVVAHAEVELHNAESSHAVGHRVTFHLDSAAIEDFRALTKAKKNTAGGRYRVVLVDGDKPCLDFDALFLGWSATHTAGAKLRYEITENTYAFFRALPARQSHTGKPASYHLVMYEVADDETLTDQVAKETAESYRGGPLAQRAGRLSASEDFRRFVNSVEHKAGRATQEEAAAFIRSHCRITSRRELDRDDAALARFRKFVERPFAIWSTPH